MAPFYYLFAGPLPPPHAGPETLEQPQPSSQSGILSVKLHKRLLSDQSIISVMDPYEDCELNVSQTSSVFCSMADNVQCVYRI